MKMWQKGLLTAVATSIAFGAYADNQKPTCTAWCLAPVKNKIYLNAMFGFGEGTGNSNLGLAIGGGVGYRINSNIASEVLFLRTPKGTGSDTTSTYMFGGAMKVSLPFSPKLVGYAKMGLAVLDNASNSSNASTTRLGVLMGAGADYYVHSNLAFGGELLGTFGGSNADTIAVVGTLNYIFGGSRD